MPRKNRNTVNPSAALTSASMTNITMSAPIPAPVMADRSGGRHSFSNSSTMTDAMSPIRMTNRLLTTFLSDKTNVKTTHGRYAVTGSSVRRRALSAEASPAARCAAI